MPTVPQAVRSVNARQGELWWNQTQQHIGSLHWYRMGNCRITRNTVTQQFAEELNVIYDLILA